MASASCWQRWTTRADRSDRRARAYRLSAPEDLETRLVMSDATGGPAVQMLSATTGDSKSVTIEYQVNQVLDSSTPLQFGVYRSSAGQFSSSDTLVDTFTPAAPGPGAVTLDRSGVPATALGLHQLTIPLPQGLPPFPAKPYVLVVADPSTPSAMSQPLQTASFHVDTIGIVTHGGIQDPSWIHGSPWQMETAYMMRHEGFDGVIAYNWVQQSSTPGEAIKQSPRLARMILDAASKFPPNDPVDLVFIGHSEGTVVNTYAIVTLQKELTPQMKAGYISDTLLDPHAANENVPGRQMSFGGVLGGLASVVVNDYQGIAKDPPAYFPASVDQANVFFEHSQATPGQIYNLWGQVPVKSDGPPVHYYNLTAMGATHSGKTGVALWYRDFVVPTLGNQAPLVQALQLNGRIDHAVSTTTAGPTASRLIRRASNPRADRVYGPAQVVTSDQPEFSGTAAPGSIIRLGLSPAAEPSKLVLAGVTTADRNGLWSLTPGHPLKNGQYRTLATAFSRTLTTRPGYGVVPTQPLGRLVVDAPSGN